MYTFSEQNFIDEVQLSKIRGTVSPELMDMMEEIIITSSQHTFTELTDKQRNDMARAAINDFESSDLLLTLVESSPDPLKLSYMHVHNHFHGKVLCSFNYFKRKLAGRE